MTDPLFFVVTGALVGFAVGLTGIGGGSLLTPVLLIHGIPLPVAVGTDLCYAAITKSSGIITHHFQKNIDWHLVLLLCCGSIPGAFCCIIFLKYFFKNSNSHNEVLFWIMGTMLIITALSVFFQSIIQRKIRTRKNETPPGKPMARCVIIGYCMGFLVTASSIGAGALGTAVLIMLFPLMKPARIVGTDIAHAVPLTITASLGHLFLGNVDFRLLICLISGSIPGIFCGSLFTNKIPVKLLRYLLACALLVFGIKYLMI